MTPIIISDTTTHVYLHPPPAPYSTSDLLSAQLHRRIIRSRGSGREKRGLIQKCGSPYPTERPEVIEISALSVRHTGPEAGREQLPAKQEQSTQWIMPCLYKEPFLSSSLPRRFNPARYSIAVGTSNHCKHVSVSSEAGRRAGLCSPCHRRWVVRVLWWYSLRIRHRDYQWHPGHEVSYS